MIALVMIAGLAVAGDLPDAPDATSPVPGQCAKSYALHEGVEAPRALFDGTVASCGGVLLPTSVLADMMAYRIYGEQVADLYRLETTHLEKELLDLRAEIDVMNQPIPWHKTPSASRWIGRAEGAILGALIGAIGWQMYQTSVASNGAG